MIEKSMMFAGLKKQSTILAELIEEIERKPSMDAHDFFMYGSRTTLVAGNLRKLRKIKESYFIDQNFLTAQ